MAVWLDTAGEPLLRLFAALLNACLLVYNASPSLRAQAGEPPAGAVHSAPCLLPPAPTQSRALPEAAKLLLLPEPKGAYRRVPRCILRRFCAWTCMGCWWLCKRGTSALLAAVAVWRRVRLRRQAGLPAEPEAVRASAGWPALGAHGRGPRRTASAPLLLPGADPGLREQRLPAERLAGPPAAPFRHSTRLPEQRRHGAQY